MNQNYGLTAKALSAAAATVSALLPGLDSVSANPLPVYPAGALTGSVSLTISISLPPPPPPACDGSGGQGCDGSAGSDGQGCDASAGSDGQGCDGSAGSGAGTANGQGSDSSDAGCCTGP